MVAGYETFDVVIEEQVWSKNSTGRGVHDTEIKLDVVEEGSFGKEHNERNERC